MAGRGQVDEAIAHYQKALEIKPDYAEAHNNLGLGLAGRGQFDEAIAHYRKALEIEPGNAEFCNNLAWLRATGPLASVREGAEAVDLAQRAVRLSGGEKPEILDTLAAAYAEAKRFPEAVQTARNAVELAARQKKQELVDSLQAKLKLYEARTPFRETPSSEGKR